MIEQLFMPDMLPYTLAVWFLIGIVTSVIALCMMYRQHDDITIGLIGAMLVLSFLGPLLSLILLGAIVPWHKTVFHRGYK